MLLRSLASCAIAYFSSFLFAQAPVPATADNTPAVQVAAFSEAAMNKKIGRGECWDLAEHALNKAGARWDGHYAFGRPVDWRTDPIKRGDILQFKDVQVERRTGNTVEGASMSHHTAIVVSVHGPGHYTIAHQNFGEAGRKVSRYELIMADVKRGSITFFRPER